MAWTTPASYAVSEIVTAAKLNTHIRDNLNYLKGAAGTIAFDAGATFAGGVAISSTGGTLLSVSGSATTTTINVSSPNVASQNAQYTLTNAGQRTATLYLDRATASGTLRLATNTLATPLMAWEPVNGWTGLMATSAPRGMIHGYDTISGILKWEFDALAAAAQTLIPDGAGDVLYALNFFGAVRPSTGAAIFTSNIGSGTLLAPGGSAALYNTGGNTVTLAVAANGSVTASRTADAGSNLTYKVSLFLLWI